MKELEREREREEERRMEGKGFSNLAVSVGGCVFDIQTRYPFLYRAFCTALSTSLILFLSTTTTTTTIVPLEWVSSRKRRSGGYRRLEKTGARIGNALVIVATGRG